MKTNVYIIMIIESRRKNESVLGLNIIKTTIKNSTKRMKSKRKFGKTKKSLTSQNSSFRQILCVRASARIVYTKRHHVWYLGICYQTLANIIGSRRDFKTVTYSAVWGKTVRLISGIIIKWRQLTLTITTNWYRGFKLFNSILQK